MILVAESADVLVRWFAGLQAIPWWGWLLAVLVASSSFVLHSADAPGVIRGVRLITLAEARAIVAKQIGNRRIARCAAWGGVEIPFSWLAAHYAFIGATGSGKTMSMVMLCRSALVTDRKLCHRALFFDPKGGDTYASLLSMGVRESEIHWMFPFDVRGSAWDIAQDVTSYDRARQIAALLVPAPENVNNPFFNDASRDLASCALWGLHKAQRASWTLLDFLEACSTRKALEVALAATEEGKRAYQTHIGESDPKTAANILSTLRTKLMPYRSVASVWERRKGVGSRFSVRAWMHGSQATVLVLSTSEKHSEALAALNRAVFKCAAEEVLDRSEERPVDETWVVLDETRAAGKFEGLQSLLEKGRSKSVHVVLGVLDIEGFETAYEEDEGKSLISQCGNVAFFRLASPGTAEYASDRLGGYDYVDVSVNSGRTESFGESGVTHGTSEGVNYSKANQSAMLPSEFLTMAPGHPDRGIEGVFITQPLHPWRAIVPPDFIRKWWQAAPSFTPQQVPQADMEPMYRELPAAPTGPQAKRKFKRPDEEDAS